MDEVAGATTKLRRQPPFRRRGMPPSKEKDEIRRAATAAVPSLFLKVHLPGGGSTPTSDEGVAPMKRAWFVALAFSIAGMFALVQGYGCGSTGEGGPSAGSSGVGGRGSGSGGTTGSGGAAGSGGGSFGSGGSAESGGFAGTGGQSSGVGGSGGGSPGSGGAPGTGGSSGTGGSVGGKISTDPNLKVAFVADTDNLATGPFVDNLKMIKSEGAQAVVFNGDLSYDDKPPADWWKVVEANLGTDFPVFISEGNHDASQWAGYQARVDAHVKASGAEVDATKIDTRGYHYTWKGLSMVFIGEDGNSQYPTFINERFASDQHLWRVCGWHKNQEAMQVGGKPDEMGWEVYEACKNMGAIIETGHEHTYHRTKTLTSMANQTVDSACSDPKQLCVGPGRTFVTVAGLGGRSIRPQLRCLPTTYPYGCKGEWAFVYTENQGAQFGVQFIVFNYNGNANKAHGYFKNVSGTVVDEFDITAN
jgi:Calcineurin-like phosphoesterase